MSRKAVLEQHIKWLGQNIKSTKTFGEIDITRQQRQANHKWKIKPEMAGKAHEMDK